MLRITVELLPHGDEDAAETIAFAKICNLRKHEAGSPLGDYHAYFEANEVPMASNPAPYLPDDPRRAYHCVSTAVVEDFPRFEGSVWDLIATMLEASGRSRPAAPTTAALAALGGRQ